jgi:hypothetical protein
MSSEKIVVPTTKKSRTDIGLRLKAFRESKALSITEFSRVSGIKSNTLSEMEGQKYDPSAEKLAIIVRNTDVNPMWLLTGLGDMTVSHTHAGASADVGQERRPMDKNRFEALNNRHHAIAHDFVEIECFGDHLAVREGYVKLKGLEAIHLYLIQKHHWLPSVVQNLSRDDLRLVLHQEMQAWTEPKEIVDARNGHLASDPRHRT